MAEAFLKKYAGDKFETESAGLEPSELNPLVVKVMKEFGIDISQNRTDSVFDFYKQGRRYHYVITVCDQAQSESCPVFPNTLERLHWSFKDPSQFEGSEQEKLAQIRIVRDNIEKKLKDWLSSL